ncbi:MAG: pantoate--beta-alanine ligase [Dehalococcoidia bacterium]|nr:MAG: pantoate--beta-alanine ligase [Dehalococcoidia bacterium]
MDIFRSIEAFRAWRGKQPGDLGLVPTMGYLHGGHLSLVRAAHAANERVAVSIFVNPTQFAPNEDLASYPRDEARDLQLLERGGVHAVFAPSPVEMYPDGFSTYVSVEGLTARLEGASRPAHFRGVTTVVLKLLNVVQPARAYFGRKDAQQLAVVRRMVRDLDVAVEIVGMPIVREPDGLALSSRNVYLSPDERRAAPVLHASLSLAEALFAAGERDAGVIRERMSALITAEPLASIDYVSVADAESLDELERIDRPALVSLAVRFGRTRLIDNTTLGT